MPNKQAISSHKITSEIFGAASSEAIELYEIYDVEDEVNEIRFHGGINELRSVVNFGGKEYHYVPYESTGFGARGDGSVARPTMRIINIDGFVSNYARDRNDLIGATIVRKKTFVRFLDAENFLGYNEDPSLKQEWVERGVDPDPYALMENEKWTIGRKVNENRFFCEFELTSPVDLENITIPRRKVINNYCFWKYRGSVCGYDGPPVADANDLKLENKVSGASFVDKGEWTAGSSYDAGDYVFVKMKREANPERKVVYVCLKDNTSDKDNKPSVNTTHWVADQCSKCLKACKMRFAGDEVEPLPFGGFPGSRIY